MSQTQMEQYEAPGGVISAARITARPEKRKELLMTIDSLLEQIRNQDGCRTYRFYGEASTRDSFILVGEWETRSDWERHRRSEHFSVLLGSLELLSAEKRPDFRLLSHVDLTGL
jgi:quinol monooxygenase YgiN